jgi:hypothetical protein
VPTGSQLIAEHLLPRWLSTRPALQLSQQFGLEVSMALNAQKCRLALADLGPGQPVFIDPPAEFCTWLAEKQLPGDVVEFLLGTAVVADVPFPSGCGGWWTPQNTMVLNDQEPNILAGGLFAVGNSGNGDFIVIDLRDECRQAGFVSHDELWEDCGEARSWTDVREIFAPVADSLDEMLAGMSGDQWKFLRGDPGNGYPCDFYPRDYCDAILKKKNG